MLVDLGVNPLRLHCLLKALDRSNSTSPIGCKYIEITLSVKGIRPVDLGVNTLRLHCLLKAFDRSNLTGQIGCKSITLSVKGIEITLSVKGIQLGINYWSNWVEIH